MSHSHKPLCKNTLNHYTYATRPLLPALSFQSSCASCLDQGRTQKPTLPWKTCQTISRRRQEPPRSSTGPKQLWVMRQKQRLLKWGITAEPVVTFGETTWLRSLEYSPAISGTVRGGERRERMPKKRQEPAKKKISKGSWNISFTKTMQLRASTVRGTWSVSSKERYQTIKDVQAISRGRKTHQFVENKSSETHKKFVIGKKKRGEKS